MKQLRRFIIGLGMVLCVFGCAAILMLNRPTFGWQVLSVPTASMDPTIPSGSMVLVHRISDSGYRVGDVITHANPVRPGTTITHRITKTYAIGGGKVPVYITKGDANPSVDSPVVGGDVQGKVVGHVPYLGTLLLWAKTWVGLAVLVYLPAFIIMGREVQRLSDYWKLSMPYKLYRFKPPQPRVSKYALGAAVGSMLIVVAGFSLQPVLAMLASNTVALTPNNIRVAQTAQPPSSCTNSNNININSTSNQTATSGNATNSGNTSGGSATSGDATNSNTTNVNISVQNGC